jgi:hypothetical protein
MGGGGGGGGITGIAGPPGQHADAAAIASQHAHIAMSIEISSRISSGLGLGFDLRSSIVVRNGEAVVSYYGIDRESRLLDPASRYQGDDAASRFPPAEVKPRTVGTGRQRYSRPLSASSRAGRSIDGPLAALAVPYRARRSQPTYVR